MLAKIDLPFTMTIGGRSVPGVERFGVINPATASVFAQAPDCTREELDQAVAAARAAFPAWAATPLAERQAMILRVRDVMVENQEEIARIIVAEQGKPYAGGLGETASLVRWSEAVAAMALDPVVVEDTAKARIVAHRVPLGVVGAITPWNYPIVQAFWKILPGLVAGNTIVLKPSPLTPLSTLRAGELLSEILPPGVLNVISGSDRLGPWLTEHPGIDKISFTGSTATGRRVMASASATLKRLTLELGGNDPAIVLPDADVGAIVEPLFRGAFRNAGQICAATKRIYVHDSLYDAFRDAFAARVARAVVGPGDQQGVEIGPVQNRAQYERVLALIADCKTQGYSIVTGGEALDGPGYFISPAVIDNPPDTARIVVEEQFGPVVPLMRYSDVDDAVRRANDTDYGLGGSIWSADPIKAAEIGARLDCGTVWVNTTQQLSPDAPFGGHKQSGIGVENGLPGLHAYTQFQTLVMLKPGTPQ
ncbi:MAG TPA: aldehyde dehydrogenase family protein [Caulobacteraceae bacterium]|nr:aldehyde dehydrogenase family protein [Caulobacteraceae bacterium]